VNPRGSVLHGFTILLAILAVEGAAVESPTPALALEGAAAEVFLLKAEVVELEGFGSKGITRPRKATLTDGERTVHAVFKDIDALWQRRTRILELAAEKAAKFGEESVLYD
jgi:hypothetical protein